MRRRVTAVLLTSLVVLGTSAATAYAGLDGQIRKGGATSYMSEEQSANLPAAPVLTDASVEDVGVTVGGDVVGV